MKKFSNISNYKVGEEPNIEVKLNEEDLFKAKILNLMDQLLTIRTYGPVDKHQRAGLIKISGKEMFLEALMGLFSDKTLKEQVKLLEGLKSEVRDWEMIDVKIKEVNKKVTESKEKSDLLSQKRNLISLYNKYKDDEELLLKVVENSCNKIKSSKTAHTRALTADLIINEGKYSKEVFAKISEKFHDKAQQLGYNG
jgi:hypothetical protein